MYERGAGVTLENVVETDVLVVGGGMAGTFAAVKAKEQGLDVTLVEKGYVSKSGGAAFAGGYFGVFSPEWGHDLDASMEQMCKLGEYINNREWVEIVLKESYERYQDLVSWGVEFVKEDDGSLYIYPSPRSGGILKSVMMWRRKYTPVMRKQTLKSGVTIMDRIMVTDLLKQDGKIVGAIGFHTTRGDLCIFKAKATVITTGTGSFKNGPLPTYYWTNDGETMAYRAGAEITGKEFCFGGGSEIIVNSPAWRGHGFANVRFMRRITAEGNVVGAAHPHGFPHPFEVHAGQAPIFWDLDAATPKDIESMLQHQKATRTRYEAERIDFDVSRGGKVQMVGGQFLGSSVHGGSSGIRPKNKKCATSIPGLYAAGDACGTRQPGSRFPGAESGMRDASVTGARAGRGAAEYALETETVMVDAAELARLKEIVYAPMGRKGGFGPRWATQQLQNLMLPYYVWDIKHEKRMQSVLNLVEFLRDHIVPKLTAKDSHELRLAHETKSLILNTEMMLRSSIFRTESRGSHYREDYPQRDDPNWLAWVNLKEEKGRMKLWKEPIPEEWWPDLSKPYEERYPSRFLGERE